MQKFDIYGDLAKRTGGDIYLGVVGPVRAGKSTFVKRFAEMLIMPNVSGKNKKQIALDELPQSGSGKTVTTTEPKFIPSDAVKVTLGKTHAKMRLIDCVGFMVNGAVGGEEDGKPRLVQTPWKDEPMPFEEAAEMGTERVIREHSTIGVVITSDGSFTGIDRKDYAVAEEKTIARLKEIGKPFTVVLNSAEPTSEKAQKIVAELKEKHGVCAFALDLLNCDESAFNRVIEGVLGEFPINSFEILLPDWLRALPPESRVISEIISTVKSASQSVEKMKDCYCLEEALASIDKVIPDGSEAFAGEGRARFRLACEKELFYDVLSETCGEAIDGEYKLMSFVRDLSKAKWEYDKIRTALCDAEAKGYGIVLPTEKDVAIGEPSLVKNGSRYGVSVSAKTESLHVVKVGVETVVNPISGTKKQCEDFIDFISKESESGDLSEANVFGRPLGKVVLDEVSQLAGAMPDETREKMQRVVCKMVNDEKYRMLYLVY
ncbi:MAG: stage IV sporulation protein A [Clostridia bacterium]|nr:stage IV sporulation protein A [Clostridia bacterium]